MFVKIVFTAAFGLLFVSTSCCQEAREEAFDEIFSDDYGNAVLFLKNEKTIDAIVQSQGLVVKEVTAIVFPELIRYNSIQDKIETFALEALYTQYGKDYANFSVGEFQIKPSFAEKVEIDFIKTFGEKGLFSLSKIKASDTIQNQENRAKRLKRIKDRTGMVNYLCGFWKVLSSRYPTWNKEEDKIKFFATAYNCGYWKSKKEIELFKSKKLFHRGFSLTSTKYNYADIAWYYSQRQ